MNSPTFAECKARIRHARRLMRELQAWVNSHPLTLPPSEIRLSRSDYDVLEWAMHHLLKAWIYDTDEEGEIIRSTGRLVRVHGGFCYNDGTENFVFKGIPVRPKRDDD